MCEPVSAIALTLGAAGTAFNVYNSVEQGNAANQAAQENAALAELAAQDAEARGGREAARAREAAGKIVGEQKVAFSGSGFDVGQGSPLAAMADTRMMGELDAQTILFNAQREAYGYRRQGRNFRAQGDRAARAGMNQAVGSFLGGASHFAGTAYRAYAPKE